MTTANGRDPGGASGSTRPRWRPTHPARRGRGSSPASRPARTVRRRTAPSGVQRSPMPPSHRAGSRVPRIAAEDRAGLDRLEGRRRLWRARVRHGGGGRGTIGASAPRRMDAMTVCAVSTSAAALPGGTTTTTTSRTSSTMTMDRSARSPGQQAEAVGKAPQLVGHRRGASCRRPGRRERPPIRRSPVVGR